MLIAVHNISSFEMSQNLGFYRSPSFDAVFDLSQQENFVTVFIVYVEVTQMFSN